MDTDFEQGIRQGYEEALYDVLFKLREYMNQVDYSPEDAYGTEHAVEIVTKLADGLNDAKTR